MQNVFLAVSKSVHKFERKRESDSFRGWLWTITRNKVRDFCRKQTRQVADAAGGTNAYAELAAVSEQLSDDSMSVTSPREVSGLLHRAMNMVKAEFEDRTWNAFWRAHGGKRAHGGNRGSPRHHGQFSSAGKVSSATKTS
jgi:RNA polymerase sigma-70 factor, ECF subfamily